LKIRVTGNASNAKSSTVFRNDDWSGNAMQGKARQGKAGFSVLTEVNPEVDSDPDFAFASIYPRSIIAHRKPISCIKEITASNQGLTDRFASKVLDAKGVKVYEFNNDFHR
jgi:hypothetical protein